MFFRAVVFCLLVLPLTVLADEPKFIEASLLSPSVQIHSPETSINGMRFGFVYTENKDVGYFDMNIIAARTKGNFQGVSILSFYDRVDGDASGIRLSASYNSVGGNFSGGQLGIANVVEKDMDGFQLGGLNMNKGKSTGIEMGLANLDQVVEGGRLGAFNMAEEVSGGELGAANYTKKVSGVQVGIVNYADELDGLQIGLVNIANNSQIFSILPIVNFNFK